MSSKPGELQCLPIHGTVMLAKTLSGPERGSWQEDERENGAGRPKSRATGVRERRLSGKSAPKDPFPAQRLGTRRCQACSSYRGCTEGAAWRALPSAGRRVQHGQHSHELGGGKTVSRPGGGHGKRVSESRIMARQRAARTRRDRERAGRTFRQEDEQGGAAARG